MSPNPMLQELEPWVEHRLLNAIDLGFAEFLDRVHPGEAPEVLLAAALTSRQYGLSHVCFDPNAFLEDPLGFLGLQITSDLSDDLKSLARTIEALSNELTLQQWTTALLNSEVVSYATDGMPLVLDSDRVYLGRNWRNEQAVAKAVNARLEDIDTTPFQDAAFLDSLFGSPKNPRPGPNMQKVACALATRARLFILTGGPGTGKTYTVVRILTLLLHREESLRILLAAPTGKAAARLTESITSSLAAPELLALPDSLRSAIPGKASTIHHMLGSKWNSRSFRHDENHPLRADVVIVDEASMIDLEMMTALLKAVPPHALLILVGDKDQLSSVEAGSVMGDLCIDSDQRGYSTDTLKWIMNATGETIHQNGDARTDSLAQQTVMLRHSERFSADSGIGKLAEAVNQGDVESAIEVLSGRPAFDDIQWIEKNRPDKKLIDELCAGRDSDQEIPVFEGYRHYLAEIKGTEHAPTDLNQQTEYFRSVLEAYGKFQVLCAVREGPWGVESLNRIIQAQLKKKRLITSAGFSDNDWYKGRPVMATRNDYELGIMNGDVGITLSFKDPETGASTLRVIFKDPENPTHPYKIVLPSRLTDVETVFAMTVHKSQGSEFGHVALMLPDPEKALVLSRELLYTGITRAKKQLTLIGGDRDQFREIIERKTKRSGRLGELLL